MTSPVRAPRPTPRRATSAPAAPSAPRRDHLRVVPPSGRAPARPRRQPAAAPAPGGRLVVLVTLLVFGSLLTAAMCHGMVASGQTRLDRLETELQDEQAALARDKQDLAELQSPEHLAAAARALGMVRADEVTWLSPGTDDPPVVTGSTDASTTVPDPSATTSDLATADGGGSTR